MALVRIMVTGPQCGRSLARCKMKYFYLTPYVLLVGLGAVAWKGPCYWSGLSLRCAGRPFQLPDLNFIADDVYLPPPLMPHVRVDLQNSWHDWQIFSWHWHVCRILPNAALPKSPLAFVTVSHLIFQMRCRCLLIYNSDDEQFTSLMPVITPVRLHEIA